MPFDLQRNLDIKRAYRQTLAAKPIAKKLRMLDALCKRARSLRQGPGRKDPPGARDRRHRQADLSAITSRRRRIDALVYELYGLTNDEIKIVEGGA